MIRLAEPSDIEHLILLGYEMHQESSYRVMDYSIEKVADFFFSLIDSDDYLLLVAEEKGEIVGGIAAYCLAHYSSSDRMACDFGLYLNKDKRGGMLAAKLVKRYVQWALPRVKHPSLVRLGISTGVHLAKTSQLYEHLGFERTGALFEYRGNR